MQMQLYHHTLPYAVSSVSYTWEQHTAPFQEWLFSWNSPRPKQTLSFFVSFMIDGSWSPWYRHSKWTHSEQYGAGTSQEHSICLLQDTIRLLQGAHAFRLKVHAEELEDLKALRCLHVNLNSDQPPADFLTRAPGCDSIRLEVPLISQIALGGPYSQRICSPVSTTAVLQYLLQERTLDPLAFATHARDMACDIFGNWTLNIAQASALLGERWHCWVQRFPGFGAVYAQLSLGVPVVVSVRGPLPGGAMPYAEGHLMVVKGYDAVQQRVLCMDPAFSTHSDTDCAYAFDDFMAAWQRRGRMGYFFKQATGL
jgi:hypothetical protein